MQSDIPWLLCYTGDSGRRLSTLLNILWICFARFSTICLRLKQGQLCLKYFGIARLFQSVDIFKSLTNKIKPLHCPSVMLVITSVTLTDFTSPQIMKSYWKHVQHLLMNNHRVYFAFAWANTNQIWSNFASLETWLYCSLIKHIKLLGILLDTMVSFRKYENDCYFYLGPGLYDLYPLGRHAQCCHCSAVSPRQSDKIFQNNIFIFSW